MSRSSSLRLVGCVTAPNHDIDENNSEKFLLSQKHSFDSESDDIEDEEKLRKENHKRVNDMIQQAKENLNKKKVHHKRSPQNKNTDSVTESEDTASSQTNALNVLRKMERLRSEKDHNNLRLNVREDKTDQIHGNSYFKKQEENLEYFTGTKRNKNKVKHKKQDRMISLSALDRSNNQQQPYQQQNYQQVNVDMPAPPTNCWQQKKGSDLFETKQHCLSDYNYPGTEQELLELAIAESIKTHKAEVERNSYTTHTFIPDVREFSEDNWNIESSELDVTDSLNHHHDPEFYNNKDRSIKFNDLKYSDHKKKHSSVYFNEVVTDDQPFHKLDDGQRDSGKKRNPVYMNEISAVKSGLDVVRETDGKKKSRMVYFNEKPSGNMTSPTSETSIPWDDWRQNHCHSDDVSNEREQFNQQVKSELEQSARDSEQKKESGADDSIPVYDSNEEFDTEEPCILNDKAHQLQINKKLKYGPPSKTYQKKNSKMTSIDSNACEEWDSARASLNKMQRKSEMDLELKYRSTNARDPKEEDRIVNLNENISVNITSREEWDNYIGNTHAALGEIQHKSQTDLEIKYRNTNDGDHLKKSITKPSTGNLSQKVWDVNENACCIWNDIQSKSKVDLELNPESGRELHISNETSTVNFPGKSDSLSLLQVHEHSDVKTSLGDLWNDSSSHCSDMTYMGNNVHVKKNQVNKSQKLSTVQENNYVGCSYKNISEVQGSGDVRSIKKIDNNNHLGFLSSLLQHENLNKTSEMKMCNETQKTDKQELLEDKCIQNAESPAEVPIEQFFNYETEKQQSSAHIPSNQNHPPPLQNFGNFPLHTVNPAVYAMLQALHQSMNMKSAPHKSEDIAISVPANMQNTAMPPQFVNVPVQPRMGEMFPVNSAMFAQQQSMLNMCLPTPQNEDVARLMSSMHIQANQAMSAESQRASIPVQTKEEEKLPANPNVFSAAEAHRQSILNLNSANQNVPRPSQVIGLPIQTKGGQMSPNLSLYAAFEAHRQSMNSANQNVSPNPQVGAMPPHMKDESLPSYPDVYAPFQTNRQSTMNADPTNQNVPAPSQVLGMPFQEKKEEISANSSVFPSFEAHQQSIWKMNTPFLPTKDIAKSVSPMNTHADSNVPVPSESRLNSPVPESNQEKTSSVSPRIYSAIQATQPSMFSGVFHNSLSELQARQFAMQFPWLYNNMLPNPMLTPFFPPFVNPMLGIVPGAVPLQCPIPPNAITMMNYGNGQNNNVSSPPVQMDLSEHTVNAGLHSSVNNSTSSQPVRTPGLTTEALTGKGRGRIIM